MRKTGLKRFVPIIARDPTKKNAGNREISTAFLGKFPVGNSLYSDIKAAETPAVGKIAKKKQEQPKISQKKQPPRFAAQNCAVKRGGCLCPLAGCDRTGSSPFQQHFAESNVPLRGVISAADMLSDYAGILSTSPCGVILEQLPGGFRDTGISTVPLRGVITVQKEVFFWRMKKL